MNGTLDDAAWEKLLKEEREIVEWAAWARNDSRLKDGAFQAANAARAMVHHSAEVLARVREKVDIAALARVAADPELGSPGAISKLEDRHDTT